jgi:aarF domain-containing kinase
MAAVVGRVTSQALAAAWRNAGSAIPFSTATVAADATSLAWPLRAVRAAGIGTAVTAFLIPAGAVAALVISGRGEADALEIFHSFPRTLRILWWSLWAAYHYKTLATSFAAATITEETFREELSELHHRSAHRLFRVLHSNGGVYVKAGQLAVSMQAVPPEYREGLVGLEDRVPPRSFADVDAVLQAELGDSARSLFKEFAEDATAAASLAQVHRAVTRDGTCVAVKVQYAGLESAVAADLATMTALSSLAAFLFPASDWRWLFTELRTKLAQELDFRHEARNAIRLAECFAGRRDVAVPALYPEMCTRKVLTMEWVDGIKVSDKAGLRRLGLAPRQVGLCLLDAAAEMMSVHGFVHGDMHPGNVMVRARPAGNILLRLLPWGGGVKPEVVLLDHGLYFEIPENMRLLYNQLWCAFVLNDRHSAMDVATALAGPRAGRALPEYLKPRDWNKMSLQERRRLREEVGVGGIRDLTRIMNEAPRQLVDCLRALAIVRRTLRLTMRPALHPMCIIYLI